MKFRILLAAALAVALACPAYADSKISQFPMGGNLTVGDIVPVVRSGINYQTTYTGSASGVGSFNTRTGTVTLTAPDVGAVLLTSASSHQFITGINSSGVFTIAQPAFTDISGTIAGAQLPTPTTSVLGGIIAQASATTHQFVQYINTSGQQILAQLGFSDLSGTLSLAQLGASYTNGQVLIGSTTDGQLHAATLTAGTNVTIVNGAGTITISATAGGGGVSSFNSRTGAVAPTSGDYTVSQVTGAAPLASPTFTGTVTLPAATAVNGVTLTTGGSSTAYLNGAGGYTTPSGSGTVNTGTAPGVAYYAASGTAVSSTSLITIGTSTVSLPYLSVAGVLTNDVAGKVGSTPTTTVNLSGGTTGFSFSPSSFSALITGGGGGLSTVNQISSGTTNTLSSLSTPRTTQAWNSSTASTKTQNIPACSSALSGYDITIVDEFGSATANHIAVVPASGTINNSSSGSITLNNQATTYECDGSTNWMVI